MLIEEYETVFASNRNEAVAVDPSVNATDKAHVTGAACATAASAMDAKSIQTERIKPAKESTQVDTSAGRRIRAAGDCLYAARLFGFCCSGNAGKRYSWFTDEEVWRSG
jgi:hypothetical protein